MRLARLLLLALLVFLFVYPLSRLLSLPLFSPATGGADARAYCDSLVLALLVGLIVAPLGAVLAQVLETMQGRAMIKWS